MFSFPCQGFATAVSLLGMGGPSTGCPVPPPRAWGQKQEDGGGCCWGHPGAPIAVCVPQLVSWGAQGITPRAAPTVPPSGITPSVAPITLSAVLPRRASPSLRFPLFSPPRAAPRAGIRCSPPGHSPQSGTSVVPPAVPSPGHHPQPGTPRGTQISPLEHHPCPGPHCSLHLASPLERHPRCNPLFSTLRASLWYPLFPPKSHHPQPDTPYSPPNPTTLSLIPPVSPQIPPPSASTITVPLLLPFRATSPATPPTPLLFPPPQNRLPL